MMINLSKVKTKVKLLADSRHHFVQYTDKSNSVIVLICLSFGMSVCKTLHIQNCNRNLDGFPPPPPVKYQDDRLVTAHSVRALTIYICMQSFDLIYVQQPVDLI